MARSRTIRSILAFAVVACLAVASTCSTIAKCIGRAYGYARAVVIAFLQVAVAKFEQPAQCMAARPVEMLQACAYALRMAKRERPRVTPGWRMCPTT